MTPRRVSSSRLQWWIAELARLLGARSPAPPPSPVPFRSQIAPARAGAGRLERSGWLTPYAVEVLEADAAWAGPGATMEVTIPAGVRGEALAAVWRLGRLRGDGVELRVACAGVPILVRHPTGARVALLAGAP